LIKKASLCQESALGCCWQIWLDIIPEKANHLRREKIAWRELNNLVNRFVNALMSVGIKKGNHAIILSHDWMRKNFYSNEQ